MGRDRFKSFQKLMLRLSLSRQKSLEEVELDGPLATFKNIMDETGEMIKKLEEDVDRMKLLHNELLTSPLTFDTAKKNLEHVEESIRKGSNSVRENFKRIQTIVKEGASTDPAALRVHLKIQQNLYNAQHHAFSETIKEFLRAQADYKDRATANLKRQLSIVGISGDEYLEDPELAKQIFTQGLLRSTELEQQNLVLLEARHDELKELEKTIVEVSQLFLELATIVEPQGGVIDGIEINIDQGIENVQKGTESLKKAKKTQKGWRKKKIYLALILLIIIPVVVLIICKSINLF